MRRSFERNLNRLNQEMEQSEPEELKGLLEELGKREEEQQGILDLQKEKHAIMEELKEDLRKVKDSDQELEKTPEEKMVREKEGNLFYEDDNGQQQPLSEGELLTDGDWGIDYYLDPESVPVSLRKRYLVEKAKRRLRQLLDQQIALNQESFARDFHKLEVYHDVRRKIESGEEIKRAGLIAEKMVKNFLTKLSYDYDLDFEVLETDVYQDVDEKLDFIILRRPHLRGVNIETSEDEEEDNDTSPHKLGVQFTINTRDDALRRKKRQIEKSKQSKELKEELIEDIILVQVTMKDVVRIFNKWQEKKQAGGPDKLIDQETKKKIFFKVLEGVLDENELEENWQKIENT